MVRHMMSRELEKIRQEIMREAFEKIVSRVRDLLTENSFTIVAEADKTDEEFMRYYILAKHGEQHYFITIDEEDGFWPQIRNIKQDELQLYQKLTKT